MDKKSIIQSAPLVLPPWTAHDNSLFLHAVANGPDDVSGWWPELAAAIPGKTVDEVKAYYQAVEHDLLEIEAGRVPLAHYLDEDDDIMGKEFIVMVKKEEELVPNTGNELLATVLGSKRVEKERRKATPWTEDEHRRFLQGLQVYGKGDWRSISRNMVVTRTATQVASHAQKYFLRQASLKEDNKEEDDKKKKKKRRRCSIHDITTADAMVQAKPSSSSPPTTSLNGGGQGRGEPALVPTTSSPTGSQGRGGQSSLPIGPSVKGVTNIDSTVVVHAQPISSTPPVTSTFYGGSVPIAVTTSSSSPPYFCEGQGRGGQTPGNFYGGQERGGQAPGNFYGCQGRGGKAPGNFYGGQGRGGQAPGSFYGGQGGGAPQPLNSFYGSHGGGAPSQFTTLTPTSFYGEQGQASRYEFSKHLAPTHVKDYSLDEEFSFRNSFISETNL